MIARLQGIGPRARALVALGVAAAAAIAAALLILSGWSGAAPDPGGPGAQRATPVRPAGGVPLTLAGAARDDIAEGPDDARKRNAAVALSPAGLVAARPFQFTGSALDRARAADCLAIAALAEAGETDPGQRAVMQVVLNRARHPTFANTICGVVFQGSARPGCQFTFACDGSLRRRYSDAAWERARRRAHEALGGRVFAPVGGATHYHTDWVYPYWSPRLEKIAQVETHLFFRWPGAFGGRFLHARYAGGEPAIAALSSLASHADGVESDLAALGNPAEAGDRPAGRDGIVVAHPGGRAFFVHLGQGASAAEALALGRRICPDSAAHCRLMAWTDRAAIPATFPVPAASRAALTFSYVREAGREIAIYDCERFASVARSQCLPPARRTPPATSSGTAHSGNEGAAGSAAAAS